MHLKYIYFLWEADTQWMQSSIEWKTVSPTDSKTNITCKTSFDAQNYADLCGEFNVVLRSKKAYDYEAIISLEAIAPTLFWGTPFS